MADTTSTQDKQRSALDALTAQAAAAQAAQQPDLTQATATPDPTQTPVPNALQAALSQPAPPVSTESGPINQGDVGDRGTADLEARADSPNVMPNDVAARQAIGSDADQATPAKESWLSKLGKIAGGAVGYGNPSDPDAQKGAGIMNIISKFGRAGAVAMGTPEQKQIAEEENKTAAELPLRLAAQQNLAAYHMGTLGINQQKADTGDQNADTKKQVADAGMLKQGFVPDEQNPGQYRSMTEKEIMNNPELEQKWEGQMTSMGLKQAEIDKLHDQLMGQFPVDPTTAALANRPDLAGKSVSAQMWKGLSGVINAKGYKVQDLGADGMWVLDRAGNKYHQVAAVGPSVARAVAFSMNKPVQAIDENGVARFTTAGQAEQRGLSPAGVGATSMGKQAQFNDIHAGIGMMRSAINGLPSGQVSPGTITALTLATRETDPNVAHQLIDTYLGSNNLSPAEQNFVVATQQLNERALSLRNIAGMGNGSDQVRAAIRAALPSAKSGNTGMMTKQLDAVSNLVDNLQTGIVKTNTPNGNGGPPSSGGAGKATHRYNPATGKIEKI